MDDLGLYCYVDTAFADCILTRYSTRGYIVFLVSGLVFWKSKKQGIMTTSSSKAEFINLTPAAKSLEWITRLLVELRFP